MQYLSDQVTNMPKYETTKPKKFQANFLLFSMHPIEGIEAKLNKFPKSTDPYPTAVSATLLWSGEAGYNMPVWDYGRDGNTKKILVNSHD